jgi:hypothetical protein
MVRVVIVHCPLRSAHPRSPPCASRALPSACQEGPCSPRMSSGGWSGSVCVCLRVRGVSRCAGSGCCIVHSHAPRSPWDRRGPAMGSKQAVRRPRLTSPSPLPSPLPSRLTHQVRADMRRLEGWEARVPEHGDGDEEVDAEAQHLL